jgi:hypothetical protein
MAKAYTEIQQTFTVDEHRAKLDGVYITAGPDTWGVGDYVMPQGLHLNEAHVQWAGCHPGDYGYTCLIHPGGTSTVAVNALQGADRVEVQTAHAPVYNPALGATDIEIWSSDGLTLLEIHPIASRQGDEVVFDGTTLLADRVSGHVTKVRYGSFSPCRGTGRLEGGLPFHENNGKFSLSQVYSMTGVIAAGLIVSSRVRTTAEAGTREVTVTFLFREPVT